MNSHQGINNFNSNVSKDEQNY